MAAAQGEMVALTGVVKNGGVEPPKNPARGKALRDFLDSTPWTVLVIFSTIWALYSSDFTFLALSRSADAPVAIVSIFVTVLFSMEIILNFVARRDYGGEDGCINKLNLYFWLDLVGTVSLLPEIFLMLGSDFGAPKAAAIARAGRAARIGARMSRIVRFVRDRHLVWGCGDESSACCCRIERFDKEEKREAEMMQKLTGTATSPADEDLEERPSQGQQISETISKRVIVLVLIQSMVLLFCCETFLTLVDVSDRKGERMPADCVTVSAMARSCSSSSLLRL